MSEPKEYRDLLELLRQNDADAEREFFDLWLHATMDKQVHELAGVLNWIKENTTAQRDHLASLGQAIHELKEATGAAGWIGTLNRETAAAVTAAETLTTEMQHAAAGCGWVRDLEKARDVVTAASESMRMVKATAEALGEIRRSAKEAVDDARKTLRIAESLIAEAIVQDDEEKPS